ncbi:MAG TPA: HEAT repeat domain-containing protein [Planctomycetota bacterium]|nr:HEAT repeat domain-containing protein [Planctomycetota bacterium]
MVKCLAVATLLILMPAAPPYIDGGGWQVTLPEIVSEFRTVTLVEVDKVNLARGAFRFRVGRPLKGKPDLKDLKLQMSWGDAGVPFKEVEAGRVAVHFTQSCEKELRTSSPGFENLIAQRACLTFMDGAWFHSTPGTDGWQGGTLRRDFELMFLGTTAELIDAVSTLLRGRDVVVKCRRRANTAETQWVRYSLNATSTKALARDPGAPAAATRPVSAWMAELRDPSSAVRAQAALALAELGPAGREAETALTRALQDQDAEVRYAVVVALGRILPEGKAAIDGLARALADEDWFVCLAAARSLRNLGERATPAVPALISALAARGHVKDFRPVRCGEALVTLCRIDPRAKDLDGAFKLIVAKLLEDERQGSFGARAIGARLLGECGPAAAATLPALTKLLQDLDGDVRVAAAEALMKIAPETQGEAALGALIEGLKHPDLLVRLRAAEALGGRGAQAKSGLPALRAAVQDPEAEVRQAAKDAVQRIGAGGKN